MLVKVPPRICRPNCNKEIAIVNDNDYHGQYFLSLLCYEKGPV